MSLSICRSAHLSFFFFFTATATTEIYTLSLHDALPISSRADTVAVPDPAVAAVSETVPALRKPLPRQDRSEEHTSELQSHSDLVCRLLLEKKKKKKKIQKYKK